MGAWIEIYRHMITPLQRHVAPYMGAWIEITDKEEYFLKIPSLPTWERGLK